MACIINASTSAGLVQSADTSGILQLQSNGTTIATVSSTGISSLGTAKAWARWTGSSAAIASSFNVSSITRNAAGDYTVNFTNALADANYSNLASAAYAAGVSVTTCTVNYSAASNAYVAPTTTTCRVSNTIAATTTGTDSNYISFAVFGN